MPVDVLVDIREPAELAEDFETHGEVASVRVDVLEAGDIAIGEVGFERKTWPDYVASFTGQGEGERSLWDQLAKLTSAFEHAYLLVEGDMRELSKLRYSDVSQSSVVGSVASVMARHGVPVVPVSHRGFLVDLAIRLARKHVEEPTTTHLPTGAVGIDAPPVERVAGCLPGVGPTLARRLGEEFGTVAGLAAAQSADLKAVEGIGTETAGRILAAIHGLDSEGGDGP